MMILSHLYFQIMRDDYPDEIYDPYNLPRCVLSPNKVPTHSSSLPYLQNSFVLSSGLRFTLLTIFHNRYSQSLTKIAVNFL